MEAQVLSVPMSLNWATQSTKFTWVPFAPTGLPVFLPLCQPGAHLLRLYRWDSSHLPGPQPTLPRQPAQAALPWGGCGPGSGAQVLPKGTEKGQPRVCLYTSMLLDPSPYWQALGRKWDTAILRQQNLCHCKVFSLVRELDGKELHK